MNFMPLILMNAILLVITILLAVADRLLVTYGRCRITVAGGRRSRSSTFRAATPCSPT